MLVETFEEAVDHAYAHVFGDDFIGGGSLKELYDAGAWLSLARLARAMLGGSEGFSEYGFKRMMCRKHHDYGPENINKFGMEGVKVRLWDKVARHENLEKRLANTHSYFQEPLNESIKDTLLDIIGYVVISYMLMFRTFDAPLLADTKRFVPETNPPDEAPKVTVSDVHYDVWSKDLAS